MYYIYNYIYHYISYIDNIYIYIHIYIYIIRKRHSFLIRRRSLFQLPFENNLKFIWLTPVIPGLIGPCCVIKLNSAFLGHSYKSKYIKIHQNSMNLDVLIFANPMVLEPIVFRTHVPWRRSPQIHIQVWILMDFNGFEFLRAPVSSSPILVFCVVQLFRVWFWFVCVLYVG